MVFIFIVATYNKNTNLFLENKMNSVVESLYYRPRPRKTRSARLFPDFPLPARENGRHRNLRRWYEKYRIKNSSLYSTFDARS